MIQSRYPLKPLSEIAFLYNGNSINKKTKQEKYTGIATGRNFIATKDIGFDGQVVYENGVKIPYEESKFKTAPAGSVFVCSEGGSAGRKTAYITQEVCFGNKLYAIVGKDSSFVGKYIYYYTRYNSFFSQFQDLMNGIIGGVSLKKFGSILIPYPEQSVQEKIVAQVEEQLSQLDSAVATMKKTKQQLEIYRQAVLKEAFQGFYTSVWRKKHPQEIAKKDFETIEQSNRIFKDVSGDDSEIELSLPNSWEYKRIGEAFEVEVGATPSRQQTEYWNGNIHWVSSGEVRFNTITETEETITENGLNNSSTNLQPVGTVLLAMIGEGKTRGKTALLGIPAAHNQNTAAILVSKTPCSPKYLYYFLMMNYDYTRRVGSGNNQKALNKERVRAIHFPFAPFSEQKEVVWEIETRLALCDKIDQTVNQSLQQAEALRQSILMQAFEGV